MKRVLLFNGWVIVWIALGVGGKKPPWIPKKFSLSERYLFTGWYVYHHVEISTRTLLRALWLVGKGCVLKMIDEAGVTDVSNNGCVPVISIHY